MNRAVNSGDYVALFKLCGKKAIKPIGFYNYYII